MGRGEPIGGKEQEIRRQSVPSLRGGVGRQPRCPVSVLTKRNKQHEKRPIYINSNICTTSSPADPQMRGSLNVQVPGAQGAFVREGC